MKRLLKRTAVVLGVVTALLLVAAASLTKAHMYRVYGGRVERVDPESYATSPERIAIRNASILAPDGEAMLEDRTVVVEDGRIVSVAAGADVPEGVTVLERGRRADLVLLNANPLDDIANTTTIEAVVVGGRLYDRDHLDAMLDAVRQANDNSRRWDLSEYR